MDMCSQIGMSATDKINDHHGLCMNTIKAAHGVLKDCSVDELSMNVTKFVNIHDDIKYDSTSTTSHKTCEFQKKNSSDKFFQSKTAIQAPEKCLVKHATFPSSGKTFSLHDGITSELSTHGDNIKSNDPSGFRSISMPVSIHYSAMIFKFMVISTHLLMNKDLG
ncbi:hypothetical protein R6Q57_004951 [Mikania cordata]